MLTIHNLSFFFGARALYENANLQIKPKDRIGLIGANGTGKSTLLRLIVGEYTADGGQISKSKDCTIGFLNQDLLSYQTDEPILQVAMQAFEEQNRLQTEINLILHKLETDYSDALIEKLTKLQERFETLDGYSLQAQAEAILEGLGFKTADLQRPLRQFSGGWRMRVMLAKLLLQRPSVLLLDEPTNHLDLPSIEWLEEYLLDYEGAVVIVSHDRFFLDGLCNVMVEVANQKLNYYAGDYTFYMEEKALRQEIQQAAFENQQAKIRQTERFIERFRAKASKARQVQSRVKSLARIERIDEVADTQAKISFRFTFGQPSGKQVLELDSLSKRFGDLVILDQTQARIMRGDKIALIGANGLGKSTVLRIIAGTESFEGHRQEGYNVQTAFYAQHQLESLQVDNDLLTELKQTGAARTETELRNLLGCFLFAADEVFKKIKVLSGGEKSRVALAKMLISEANFLLLDEPTNHLDMQSVNILIQSLQQYQGSYVVVSHDRFFVSQIANKIWYIENQQIKEYPGTYAEYEEWRSRQSPDNQQNTNTKFTENSQQATQKPSANDHPDKNLQKQLKQLQTQLNELENQIEQCEKEKKTFETLMADPQLYEQPEQLQKTQAAYKKVEAQLQTFHQNWEALALQIDTMATQG
ncbi:MAG TPA: ABC transporter ATP-binding protein [Microscillaceae bacterium]|nr:ABC transporter ATP-binding protein [Microscillaceae bacterium]